MNGRRRSAEMTEEVEGIKWEYGERLERWSRSQADDEDRWCAANLREWETETRPPEVLRGWVVIHRVFQYARLPLCASKESFQGEQKSQWRLGPFCRRGYSKAEGQIGREEEN